MAERNNRRWVLIGRVWSHWRGQYKDIWECSDCGTRKWTLTGTRKPAPCMACIKREGDAE